MKENSALIRIVRHSIETEKIETWVFIETQSGFFFFFLEISFSIISFLEHSREHTVKCFNITLKLYVCKQYFSLYNREVTNVKKIRNTYFIDVNTRWTVLNITLPLQLTIKKKFDSTLFYVSRPRYVLKRELTFVQVINRVCFKHFFTADIHKYCGYSTYTPIKTVIYKVRLKKYSEKYLIATKALARLMTH